MCSEYNYNTEYAFTNYMRTSGDSHVPYHLGVTGDWGLPLQVKITLKKSKIYNRLYFIKYIIAKKEKPTLDYNFYLVLRTYVIQLF